MGEVVRRERGKHEQKTIENTVNQHRQHSTQDSAQEIGKRQEIDSSKMVRNTFDELRTIKGVNQPKIFGKWDALDVEILRQIRLGRNQKKIAEYLGIPLSSLKRRFNRMRKYHVIDWDFKPIEPGSRVREKAFLIKSNGTQILNYAEGKLPAPLFDSMHRVAFETDVISGSMPKSDRPLSMKNWKGYAFEGSDYTIHTHEGKIPKLVIFIDVDLGKADNIMQMAAKYIQLAQARLNEFKRTYRLETGLLAWYQDCHCEIEDTPLAHIIGAVFGEVLTKNGMMVNKSKGKPGIEIQGIENAYGLEWTIANMPHLTGKLDARMDRLETKIDRLVESSTKVIEGIGAFVNKLDAIIPTGAQEDGYKRAPESKPQEGISLYE